MKRHEVQRQIRAMEAELRDWLDLAAQRQLNDHERHLADSLERRIDRLRTLVGGAARQAEQITEQP